MEFKDTAFGKVVGRVSSNSDIQKAQLKFYNSELSEYDQSEWDVMLNPSSIRRRIGRQMILHKGTGKEGELNVDPTYRDEHFSMQLIFDIVDAYDMYMDPLTSKSIFKSIGSTSVQHFADGEKGIETHKYPSKALNFGIKHSESYISLENREISCLPYLIRAAGSVGENAGDIGTRIKFAWGNLSIIGYITDLSVDYTYFSPKGYPLRAYVDLTIYRLPPEPLEYGPDAIDTPDIEYMDYMDLRRGMASDEPEL